jgi:hypothetical protein
MYEVRPGCEDCCLDECIDALIVDRREAPMRRVWTALLTLGLVVALAGPTAANVPDGAEQAAKIRRQLAPQSHVPCTNPTRDNFGTLVRNHFGNPGAGQAVIDSWILQRYGETCFPDSVQGQARGIRLYRVARIALRVVLHTRGGTTDADATADAVNSGNIGNPRLFTVVSPSISAGFPMEEPSIPQFCQAWTEAVYNIRWDDGTLSTGTFTVPSDLWNDNCYFLNT